MSDLTKVIICTRLPVDAIRYGVVAEDLKTAFTFYLVGFPNTEVRSNAGRQRSLPAFAFFG